MTRQRKRAFGKLKIKEQNKTILCLDGGGIRGIMTLQLLKALEGVAGIPCHELFDMVSGTSTGGIIAGLIAMGRTAAEIEGLYVKLVRKVFKNRPWPAHRLLNPPQYSKENYRRALMDIVGGDTTLQKACRATGIDLMITSKDVAAGEETFFTCFCIKKGRRVEFSGEYRSILLRAAMEATMSAPTYFTPLERFVDGGVTTYNNPSLAAIIEAVRYAPGNKYNINELSVFSFGSGCRPQFVKPKDVPNPPGSDASFWLQWLMTEAGDDASDLQTYLLRTKQLFPDLDFRRFQISLDPAAMRKLPNQPLGDIDDTNADWLRDLSAEELAEIQLDNVKYFPVMRVIGQAVVAFIAKEAQRRGEPPFSFDLISVRNKKELLVTRGGDVAKIRKQMSSRLWLDNFDV